jgi:hypothetical protein
MGAAFGIGGGLGEDTTQFDFPGTCGLPLGSAGAPFQLGVHHRQLGTIHFDDQHGNGSAQNVGELQLHEAISLGLFPLDDIGADGFGVTFDSFRGDLNTSQQLELLAATGEAGFTSHYGHHPPHSGRTICSGYIQFPVSRALTLVAVRTHIVGALEDHRPQYREYLLAPCLVIPRRMAAIAGRLVAVRCRQG